MKKVFFYLLLAATPLSMTSCDNDNGQDWDRPESYAFATVMEVEAEKASDEEEGDNKDHLYFKLDNNLTFTVGENKSNADYSTLEAGERVIVGVTLCDSDSDEYDHSAELYDIEKVFLGQNIEVTTQEESDAIADHAATNVSKQATLTYGYLNLFVEFSSEDIKNVEFYLVENLIAEEADESEKSYLSLELRFDDASGDEKASATEYQSYVSFDMESYREKLEGKDGVALRVKTGDDKISEIEIDSTKLFPSEE